MPPGAAAAPAPCRGMRSGWRCGGGDRSPGRERAAAGGPGAPQRGTAPSPPRCCGGARGARECAWELVSSHGRAVLSPNHLDPGRVCGVARFPAEIKSDRSLFCVLVVAGVRESLGVGCFGFFSALLPVS